MTAPTGTRAVLDRIIERTAADLAERKERVPLRDLERRLRDVAPPLDFQTALAGSGVSVIAEVKRGSPSRGRFPVAVDPVAAAADYVAGGAAAISVLTDQPFFFGDLDDLTAVASVAHAASAPLPVLRKDFVVDPYQVVEARSAGADSLLLIVAALDDQTLADLLEHARLLGMEPLVEVHDGLEMERAAGIGARVIGINNRDLRTFRVDLGTTERLAPMAPPGSLLVGESGVFGPEDVARLGRAGVSAVLVGEGVIVAPDRVAAVRALVGTSR